MVAKHVELAATLAGAVRQGKRQMQPSTQEKTERLGVDPRCSRSWECGERGRSQRGAGTSTMPSENRSSEATQHGCRILPPTVWWLSPAVPRLFRVHETFRRCVRDNFVQDGTTRPAVVNELCTDELLGSTEQSSKCLIINSAMKGCLSLTIRKKSAQLAKWAAPFTLSPSRQGQRGDDGHGRLWPNRLWPTEFGQPFLVTNFLANPTVASVSVSVVWPTLAKPTAKTDFGQTDFDLWVCVWVCVGVCLCVFVCVCCVAGHIWYRPSRDRPSRDRPSRDRPKFRSIFPLSRRKIRSFSPLWVSSR